NQGLAEHTGSSDFTEKEILHIMNHPIMTDENPSGLLYQRILIILYKSKTNQRGVDNIESQGEKLLIPEISKIIKMYEKYFAKRSTQAS
ncbi:10386_t:CDS:2, partial [Funneliformis geosporum]